MSELDDANFHLAFLLFICYSSTFIQDVDARKWKQMHDIKAKYVLLMCKFILMIREKLHLC